MNDPDFIKMLDDADTELAKKPVSVLNISDDEPAIADVTLSPREVMLGDCVKPLAFKHMRGDTFLSSQRLIDVLPTEDDTTGRYLDNGTTSFNDGSRAVRKRDGDIRRTQAKGSVTIAP